MLIIKGFLAWASIFVAVLTAWIRDGASNPDSAELLPEFLRRVSPSVVCISAVSNSQGKI